MHENFGFDKYRAILGDDQGEEFAIVTVTHNGNISWAVIDEQRFEEAEYADLPEDLFDQVNDIYKQLRIGDDDDLDETS